VKEDLTNCEIGFPFLLWPQKQAYNVIESLTIGEGKNRRMKQLEEVHDFFQRPRLLYQDYENIAEDRSPHGDLAPDG
jgi:hypothetical protein